MRIHGKAFTSQWKVRYCRGLSHRRSHRRIAAGREGQHGQPAHRPATVLQGQRDGLPEPRVLTSAHGFEEPEADRHDDL